MSEQICERCDIRSAFTLFCFLPECKACFHSVEEVLGHFSREQDEDHQKYSPLKELTIEEIQKTLGCTVKRDEISKAIVFLCMLVAQTQNEAFNIMFSASSSTGKSYIPEEIAAYFPENEIIEYSGASPTSFFHEKGERVLEVKINNDEIHYTILEDVLAPFREELQALEENKNTKAQNRQKIQELKEEIANLQNQAKILVDLEGKIVIFLDQPTPELLVKLRPFLSHDKKEIEIPITDKMGHGGLRTKHVILRGFASIIFCTVSAHYDEQESSRNFVLSPESDQEKIIEGLRLLDEKLSDLERFKISLNESIERKALKFRINLIRALKIRSFKFKTGVMFQKFQEIHKFYNPRAMRDFTRLFSLAYGHALLNYFNREHEGEGEGEGEKITASNKDVEAAFELYTPIMRANEAGVSPEVYSLYADILCPLYGKTNEGIEFRKLSQEYFDVTNKTITAKKLREYLKALEMVGLISSKQDPDDKRRLLFEPIGLSDLALRGRKASEWKFSHILDLESLESVCVKCGTKVETLPIFKDGECYHQGCLI